MRLAISLLSVLCLVVPLAAREVQVVPGGDGERPIRYTTETGTGGERRVDFNAGTPVGTLEGTLVDGESTLSSALSLDGRPVATLTLNDPPDSFEVEEVVLDFGALGRMVYHLDNATDSLMLMQHTVRDCDALRDSPGFRAIELLWRRIAEQPVALPALPDAGVQWVSLLTLYARLPSLVDDCNGFYRPEGQCNWNTPRPDYEGCKECCETMFSIAEFCASVSAICSVRIPQCKWVAMVCGGAAAFAGRDYCVQMECSGLPGDPSCPPDLACEERVDGAACYVICPIGGRRVCGSCSEGSQTECCVK